MMFRTVGSVKKMVRTAQSPSAQLTFRIFGGGVDLDILSATS